MSTRSAAARHPAAVLALAAAAALVAAPAAGSGDPGAQATARAAAPKVLLVGDSVMLGASRELRRTYGRRAVIDAAVSRQFPSGAAAVLAGLRRVPRNATVVIHLGNNGYVPFKQLESLMRRLSRRPRVVLVTVRVARTWQTSVNGALRYAKRHHRNVVIADWHRVSGGRGILADGTHTTPRGARLYARTIRAAAR